MGESDTPVADLEKESTDKNMALKTVYFDKPESPDSWQAPERKCGFPLSKAVAASAAVPGIFTALPITNLYEGIRVELVDGGVQDNQGIRGIADCEYWIVSDASRQMDDLEMPSESAIGAATRSQSIMSDRIRDAQVEEVVGRGRVAMMDLRGGLVPSVPPLHDESGSASRADAPPKPLDWDVEPKTQDLLSRVRTDLDFFTRFEASSLELDGYRMTGEVMRERWGEFASIRSAEAVTWPDWVFEREVGALITRTSTEGAVLEELEAASRKFFRIFRTRNSELVIILLAAILGLIAFALNRTELGDWPGDVWDWVTDMAGIGAVLLPTFLRKR